MDDRAKKLLRELIDAFEAVGLKRGVRKARYDKIREALLEEKGTFNGRLSELLKAHYD